MAANLSIQRRIKQITMKSKQYGLGRMRSWIPGLLEVAIPVFTWSDKEN